MAANQIHLVRHGEVFNPDRVLYGRIPGYGLSDRGHEMAKMAADDLAARARPVARLIASPLQRAQESAAPIAALLGHHIDTEERIIEPSNHFEGKRMRGENSALKNPANWPYLLNPFRPSWGEAYRSIADRMLAAMTEAALDVESGDVVMVSHQLPIWMVHRAVAQIVGTARHHDLESALLRTQAEMSTLSTELALRLAEHGVRDPRLADLLRRHAGAVRGDTALTVRVYRAAVEAGATELRARLADALGAAGDCAAAAALADDLLGSDDPAERAAAVRVAAGVAAHDGNLTQAAELFSWLGPDSDAAVSAAAAVASIGTGDAVAARAALATGNGGPPTAAARAARSLADGLLLTLESPYPTAAAKLGQAMAVDHPAGVVMPDSAPALITLAALHGGDPVRARSVIGRAVRVGGVGGEALFEHRHRLLLAWVKMQDGQLSAAGVDLPPADRLHRRDALWAAALRTALARRGGDPGAAQKQWYAAMEVLAEYAVDLFSLLPLGELWMAAARMGQQDRLAPMLENAFAILGELGDPPTWSVPLHWAGVHAGILANDPAAVAPHGQALAAAAAQSPFARALAGAGRTWLRVLAGQVDPDEVAVAARGLAQFGLTSDATRLAGQAALQADDARASGLMLQLARDLKLAAADTVDEGAADAADPATADLRATRRAPSSPLSDREREVAELLLLGMPYRDIGAQLFISAKTVEHHVARIRRRLGAESRSEMLSMLRAMLAPQA